MVSKTNIDDYYSSVDSEKKVGEWKNIKKKIVVKKKVVLKKVEPKKEIKPEDEDKKEITLNDRINIKSKSKMSVIRKDESKKGGYKKFEPKNTEKRSFVVKSEWNNSFTQRKTWNSVFWTKKPENNWSKYNSSNVKPQWEKKFENSENKPKKNFKAWGGNKKNYDDNRKSKLSPYSGRKNRWRFGYSNEETGFVRSNTINKKKKEEKKIEDIKQNLVDRKGETIVVPDILNLKELSEKLGVSFPSLIAEFMKNGLMVNINSKIDFETASIVSEAFDIKLKRDDSKWVNVEDILVWDISKLLIEDDISKLVKRPPVISIMWHVDHGKTSLLDYIRETKVTSWEAWGITQSIWAYQVEKDWNKITFLDTPGHEAFTIMRARWAKSTDIAILVVAADEWVKPQTIESINHAKEANIPVIVAINKMDKEWANPDHVKGQLSEHWLTPEDWGGDTPMVPVSAITWFW